MFPAKSEEILASVSLSEPHIFLARGKFGIRNSSLCACSPLIVFLARPTTIDGHRNSIALPSLTQFFSPTHHSRMFWPTPELLEPSKLIVFGFRIV